jgi:hypothetical protein
MRVSKITRNLKQVNYSSNSYFQENSRDFYVIFTCPEYPLYFLLPVLRYLFNTNYISEELELIPYK